MDITDTADNITNTDSEIKRRVLINYPQITGDGKAEKRMNAFIAKVVEEYKKNAAKASLYTYHRLKYRICSTSPLSLLFECEHRGKDGLFSYSLFSVTFSDDGYAVPLLLDKTTVRDAKKFFSGYDIKLSRRDMKYSYYQIFFLFHPLKLNIQSVYYKDYLSEVLLHLFLLIFSLVL